LSGRDRSQSCGVVRVRLTRRGGLGNWVRSFGGSPYPHGPRAWGRGSGVAGALELAQLGEGLGELVGVVPLVADDLVEVAGPGQDALAPEVADLEVERPDEGSIALDEVADAGLEVGEEFVRLAVERAGDGVDEALEPLDGPVGQVFDVEAVRDDVRRAEGVRGEAVVDEGDGGEDQGDVATGERGLRLAFDEAGEGALDGAELGEVLADGALVLLALKQSVLAGGHDGVDAV